MDGVFGKGHHLHLIDGSAFIFRAYHALPPLTRKSDGLPVGAVVDLVAAAGAVGDDQIVGAFAAGGSRPRFRLRRGYLTTKERRLRPT